MTMWPKRRVPLGREVTVIAAVADFPSQDAAMVAPPADIPVTTPFASTLATAWLPDAQVTDRPWSWDPLESMGAAASWSVAPTPTLAAVGLTSMRATVPVETGAVRLDPPPEEQPASGRRRKN